MHEIQYAKENQTIRTGLVKSASGTAGIVKNVVSAFRTYSLYPEDHALTRNGLKHISKELIKYTDTYDSLVLVIEKDGIYTGGQPVYSGAGDDDPFLVPLTRDGIVKIEFIKGIGGKEIAELFRIIKKNRMISDEAECDTVTDLWESDLVHIRFQSAEFFWDSDTVFSFPKPSKGLVAFSSIEEELAPPKEIRKEKGQIQNSSWLDYEPSFYKPANLDGPLFAGMDLSFNPDELIRLESIVKEHETIQNDDDVLDLLLFVLEEVAQSDDLSNVLASLAGEFGRVLQQGEVYKAYSIIEKIADYHSRHAWLKPFVAQRVDEFMKSISGPVFEEARPGLIPVLNMNNPGDIFFLRKVCMALESSAVITLCDVLALLESQSSRDLVLDIVKNKAREDGELIERMMANPDKTVVLIAISLLKKIKDSNSDYLLFKALKHSVEQVRSSALDYFTEKPVTVLNSIFFLLDDPSMDVRIKLLKFIGSKRAVTTETLMLEYLDRCDESSAERNHVLTCYRMLGKCGSERSIPFLRKKVFNGAWSGLIGAKKNSHREGALLALSELGSAESLRILKKASKSRSPLIRKAYSLFMQ